MNFRNTLALPLMRLKETRLIQHKYASRSHAPVLAATSANRAITAIRTLASSQTFEQKQPACLSSLAETAARTGGCHAHAAAAARPTPKESMPTQISSASHAFPAPHVEDAVLAADYDLEHHPASTTPIHKAKVGSRSGRVPNRSHHRPLSLCAVVMHREHGERASLSSGSTVPCLENRGMNCCMLQALPSSTM